MSEQMPEDDYATQIKAIFANPALVAAMRKRLPNQGAPVEPAIREMRWDNAVKVFCQKDTDWWSILESNGK